MVHWKARGLFGVHRGELRTATAQWLREENAVFTVLWKSLRHGRPQRSSEPSHYSWESPNIVEKLFVKMPAQLFACLIWSSKEIHCSPNFVQKLSVKMPVPLFACFIWSLEEICCSTASGRASDTDGFRGHRSLYTMVGATEHCPNIIR